jgi:hypothetical protein
MMAVSGSYVKTFAQASHALPEGMHMNADYPLMLPRIASLEDGKVTLSGRDGPVTAEVKRSKGREFCVISQGSSFETLFSRPAQPFRFYPFKDERTPAIGGPDLFAAAPADSPSRERE